MKVSLILNLYSLADHNESLKHPVPHHFPGTLRTVWSEMLLIDGMDQNHLRILRNVILLARARDGDSDNATLERREYLDNPLKTQDAVYPSLFTSAKSNQYSRIKYETWCEDSILVRMANLLKFYLLIGVWVRQPLLYALMADVRTQIANYVNKNPALVELFMQLLEIAEPSGTLKDSWIYQAAGVKPTVRQQLQKDQDSKVEEEDTFEESIIITPSVWPCENFACFHSV